MSLKRATFGTNQQFRTTEAKRISTMIERHLGHVMHEILSATQGGAPLSDRESGYFGDGGKVVYVSGDRGVGMIFKLSAGLGYKWRLTAQTDGAKTVFEPIVIESDYNMASLAASDPTNPRIDRVFVRPKIESANAQNVNVYDPITDNVSVQSVYQDEVWRFEYVVAQGTPAASPALPSVPVGWDAEDEVAQITVQPGSGGFSGGDLSDERKQFKLSKDIVDAIASLAGSAVTLSPTVLGQANAQDALTSVASALLIANQGLLIGRLEWVSTSSVALRRDYGGAIAVEIAGSLLVKTDADLTFSMGSHLFEGTEQASKVYYLYVQNSAGSILPKISATAPAVVSGGGAKLYHPVQTSFRCIGAIVNDASSNLVQFDPVFDGAGPYARILFREKNGTLVFAPGTGGTPTTWTEIDLTRCVPEFARSVRLLSAVKGSGRRVAYGPRSLVGGSLAGVQGLEIGSGAADPERGSSVFDVPLDPETNPARIAWRLEAAIGGATNNISEHELVVLGW